MNSLFFVAYAFLGPWRRWMAVGIAAALLFGVTVFASGAPTINAFAAGFSVFLGSAAIIGLVPNYVAALRLRQAVQLVRQGQFEEAIARLDSYCRRFGGDRIWHRRVEGALVWKAAAQLKSGRNLAAAATADEVLRRVPTATDRYTEGLIARSKEIRERALEIGDR